MKDKKHPSNGTAKTGAKIRSLPIHLWPAADKNAWEGACRPSARLKAAAYGALGVALAYSGQPTKGLAALETCIRLDPRDPSPMNRLNQIALAHYFCRDYEATIEAAKRAIRSFPDFPSPYRWLAAALGELGRTTEAKAALEKAIAVSPDSFDFQVRERPAWFRPEEHAHMLDGLRKAGWES
jgi:adenylate cyclase